MKGIIAAAAAAFVGVCAHASVVFSSNPGVGSFSGTLDFQHTAGSKNGIIIIEITNTTSGEDGGYLTAIAFNPAEGVFARFNRWASDGISSKWGPTRVISIDPYGSFASGAGLGGKFRRGPAARYGIAAGDTAKLVFDVRGESAVLYAISVHSILDESNGVSLITRFRGFDSGIAGNVTANLPAPGAAAVLGLGLGFNRRRRR